MNKRLKLNAGFSGKLILKRIVAHLFASILDTCDQLLKHQEPRLTQNQALQVLFDLKFFCSLLDVKAFVLSFDESSKLQTNVESLLSRVKETSTRLEALVDPFDLDICMPFIQSNVSKCVSRTAVSVNGFSYIRQNVYSFALRLCLPS